MSLKSGPQKVTAQSSSARPLPPGLPRRASHTQPRIGLQVPTHEGRGSAHVHQLSVTSPSPPGSTQVSEQPCPVFRQPQIWQQEAAAEARWTVTPWAPRGQGTVPASAVRPPASPPQGCEENTLALISFWLGGSLCRLCLSASKQPSPAVSQRTVTKAFLSSCC